ncbi:hypothetical protein A2690_04045 [Candidatus Roizmanbacteria bacterium RIFCSPHIGHO2_01_FULL_39_12b]|uniref:DUF1648 domain-containing protein n=1 Tax=Candidatus Roizmanbacteria bacterium RIFCSPHIGHO2_01_FULL_39_12b TaxID=1802030 RepID=A0A1F7GC83_9BACT|nr:MAG: hypothetical protein A2690_04045 [Candidatus Roizmanbacteria bacterium RIFCSPHIGHO2_01_FULL_39_12b]OGK47113.1 MAG: hypothetical protein A3B46_01770 [Candidatus Roizmanbacteria bacterium RIFCSPLOWO2_01_FULL_39_19]
MKKISLFSIFQFILVIVTIIIALLKFPILPPQIPLFYSMSTGRERVVDSYMILIIPIVAIIFLFFNKFVLVRLCSDNELVLSMLRYINTAIVILTSLICLKILFLVT